MLEMVPFAALRVTPFYLTTTRATLAGIPGDAPYASHTAPLFGSTARCRTSAPRLGNGKVSNLPERGS